MGAALIIWSLPLVSLGTQGLTFLGKEEWDRKSGQQGEVKSHQKGKCPVGTTQLLSSPGSAVCWVAQSWRRDIFLWSAVCPQSTQRQLHPFIPSGALSPNLPPDCREAFLYHSTPAKARQAEAEAETDPELD